MNTKARADDEMTDAEAVRRVVAGDHDCFAVLMRRYNQRMYRAARAVLRDDQETEDAMQEAYTEGFRHLATLETPSSVASWLTRIVVRKAIARHRKRAEHHSDIGFDAAEDDTTMSSTVRAGMSPEFLAVQADMRRVLEAAIDALPSNFRAVFIMRAVQELSVAETAECLDVPAETVKTRFHRARGLLQESMLEQFGGTEREAFPFHASRCDRVVAHVMEQITTEARQ